MFDCEFCGTKFLSIDDYNAYHFNDHHENHPKIKCLYTRCNTYFINFSSFRQHIRRQHPESAERSYICKYRECGLEFTSLAHLKEHFSWHSKKLGEPLNCGFCGKACNTKNAYNVHLNRYHQNRFDPVFIDNVSENVAISETPDLVRNDQELFQSELSFASIDPQVFNESAALLHDNLVVDDSPQDRVFEKDIRTDEAVDIHSKLYVRLETQHFATEPLIQDIVRSTSSSLSKCQEKFESLVSDSSLTASDRKIVKDILNESFGKIIASHDINTGIFRSTYTRRKLYHANPKYVKPMKVMLHDQQGNVTEQYYSYVPPLETLKLMLEDEDVRKLCDSHDCAADDDDYFVLDGDVIKKNPFFIVNKDGLKIILFQDAFNVCCPLGAAKTQYKIIGIYMMLGNLPPHMRSKTNNIKLVMLCPEKHVNTFGWDEILSRLVIDLKTLETDGISFSASGTIMNRKGTLTSMTGDNLGSHDVGRFTRNFSTVQYFSRYCESTLQELRQNFHIAGKMRTPESYDANAAEAVVTGKMVKGVNSNSKLNELDFYHVIPGLPPCIAHDILRE
ncbi:hypothetical protein QAD02_017587 [Eretmocerus hayati]|uniref:Uncharacterized protein n=1 Tax=Eretmocerus hayati TaxID=131215 RepID=A0ACC2PJ37_9HYME|nr:hypothetical protein QAD02_017587 [Eretmocerus hayati]